MIGFFGSLHCLGMCGPIAMSMYSHSWFKSILYNSGRVVSYAALGAILGSIGTVASLFGIQQELSIAAGVAVLLIVLVPRLQNIKIFTPWQKNIIKRLRSVLTKAIAWRSTLSYFLTGVLNGLLPCGLVYLAAITAIASGSISESMLTMMAFGVGTWPMMLAIGWGTSLAKGSILRKMKFAIPVFAILMGSILIIRGLGLDIPYLSPVLELAGLGLEIPVCR